MTVIGILMFMMAVITGVFVKYGQQAKVKATQQLINRVGIGLARYQADCRALPPDTGYGLPVDSKRNGNEILYDAGSLWRYLSQPVVQRRADGSIVRTLGPYLSFKEGELKPYDDSVYGKSYSVVDAWYHPLGYVGDRRRVIHNRGGFDVYSAGANQRTAIDDGLDNDEGSSPNLPEQNDAYDGAGTDDASELGEAALSGTLTFTKKHRVTDEVLDDQNNWDPQE